MPYLAPDWLPEQDKWWWKIEALMAVKEKRAEQRFCQLVSEQPEEQYKHIFSPLYIKKSCLETNLAFSSTMEEAKKIY